MAAVVAPASPQLARSLSSRRGSMSAPDPFAVHTARESLSRTVSSTLTIVRVPSVGADDHEREGDAKRRRRRSSGASATSNGSGHKISFANAFSPFAGGGFTSMHSPTPTRPAPIGGAGGHHSRKSSSNSIASLPSRPFTPAEIVDLAHDAKHPSTANGPPLDATQPFTELADDELLPFIDRPAEVSALIATPPTSKLVALVSQTLAANDAPPDTSPALWSKSQFETWLTTATRKDAPDAVWIAKLQECVSPHSELLWERLKDALGVPSDVPASESFRTMPSENGDVDIEPVFLESTPGSPILEDVADGEAIQGLRILNSPSALLQDGQQEARPRPVAVHPHVTPHPLFPRSFSDLQAQPAANYAHLVAQRILNNGSPAR